MYEYCVCVCMCMASQRWTVDLGYVVQPNFTMRWISTAILVGFKCLFSREAIGFICGY